MIYLDNSATTKVLKEAADKVYFALTENYGNPSSLHKAGVDALCDLTEARETLAGSLKADPSEIYFTGSGTVANNTAIFGSLKGGKGRIITSAFEHPSVSECIKSLELKGCEVVRLAPTDNGKVSMEDFKNALTKDTALVSIMAVNNETGAINQIDQIGDIIKSSDCKALYHVDAVQAFGKIPLNPKKSGIDLLTVSSHKIHGPKGAGALYIRSGVNLKPYILGGGQEKSMFSGTEPLPSIAGFSGAVKALPDYKETLSEISVLRDEFVSKILKIDGVFINSPSDALPYIINLSVLGIPSQTMVNALSLEGICVSAGSACKKGKRSDALVSLGLSPERIDSAIRISLSRFTAREELNITADAIKKIAERVRR